MLSEKYVARKIPTLIKFMRGRKYFPLHRPHGPRPSRCPLHKRDREHVKYQYQTSSCALCFTSHFIQWLKPTARGFATFIMPACAGFSRVNIHPCSPPGPTQARVQSIKRDNQRCLSSAKLESVLWCYELTIPT